MTKTAYVVQVCWQDALAYSQLWTDVMRDENRRLVIEAWKERASAPSVRTILGKRTQARYRVIERVETIIRQ